MNVDLILSTFRRHEADFVLIGGMNFFLVHSPVTTFDVDLWVKDDGETHRRVHHALAELAAEVSFSPKGDDWQLVGDLADESWLRRSAVFGLNSPPGAVNVSRSVTGLDEGYAVLAPTCPLRRTPTGIEFRSLSDELMIKCQLALPKAVRKLDRLRALGFENPDAVE